MWLGIKSLSLIAAALYLCSWLALTNCPSGAKPPGAAAEKGALKGSAW